VEPVKTEQIDFMGEKVIIPADFPKELSNQSQEDFSKYFNALKANSNARETGGGSRLSYEELYGILGPYVKKYPDLSWEKIESHSKNMTAFSFEMPL
jgi:hypothetical protein